MAFSDIFKVKLSDGTQVRGCFALWKRKYHLPGLAFDSHLRSVLVTTALQTLAFKVPCAIFRSDQGKQFGAEVTRKHLLEKASSSP